MKYTFGRLLDAKTARLAINAAVVISLAWVVSLWVNMAISTKLADTTAYLPPKPAVTARRQTKSDYSIIKRRNIFNPGQSATPTAAEPDDKALMEAAPTTLNLQLIGTVNTSTGENSFAVILDKATKKQSLLQINDEVAPGAIIVAINRLSVLIDNAGRMESLSIDMKESFPKPGLRGKSSRMHKASTDSNSVRKISDNHLVLDKRFLEQQLTKVNELMTQVRAVPHMNKDKQMDGFKVFQIKQNSIFQKVGLKNHDVIQRINGQTLDSVEKGLDLFAALRDESQFTIDILRNNAKKSITIEVQ